MVQLNRGIPSYLKLLTAFKTEEILFCPISELQRLTMKRRKRWQQSRRGCVHISTRPLCRATDKETENQRKADDERKITTAIPAAHTRSSLTSPDSQSYQLESV